MNNSHTFPKGVTYLFDSSLYFYVTSRSWNYFNGVGRLVIGPILSRTVVRREGRSRSCCASYSFTLNYPW
jgi:hypothetical protein